MSTTQAAPAQTDMPTTLGLGGLEVTTTNQPQSRRLNMRTGKCSWFQYLPTCGRCIFTVFPYIFIVFANFDIFSAGLPKWGIWIKQGWRSLRQSSTSRERLVPPPVLWGPVVCGVHIYAKPERPFRCWEQN